MLVELVACLPAAFNLELEVLQRDFYYPFGLSMEGAWIAGSTDDPRMDYRYNGKELSQVTGLYAYGARYYDPSIGRFGGVDPLADHYAPISPFAYVANNPISLIDPDGMSIASADHDYFDKNGNYLGSDDKGDEIRIIQDYDSSKDLYSQSSIYTSNYLTPDAHANIGSFYLYQNDLAYIEVFAMDNGLSDEMEIRAKDGNYGGSSETMDNIGISISLNPISTYGKYKGKTNIKSFFLNNINSYQSILLHEADHYFDYKPLGKGKFLDTYWSLTNHARLRHVEIYANQINNTYFTNATSEFQDHTYNSMMSYYHKITSSPLKRRAGSIINGVNY